MADEQNKSKAPAMNGGFGLSEIEKIGQSAYTVPKSEQKERDRARTARDQLNLLSDIPQEVIAGSKALSRIQATAPNTLRQAQGRIQNSAESRLERSNLQASNVVSREYQQSSINGQIRDLSDDKRFQNQALTMMGSSYEDLSSQRKALNSQVQELGANSISMAGNLFTNRGQRKDIKAALNANAVNAQSATESLASIELAMKSQRAQGLDPLSKYEKLNSTGGEANKMMSAMALGEEMRNGGVNISRGGEQQQVKNADINSALASEANILAGKLKELSESAGKSTEELEKLRKEAEESAGNFEKLKAASGGGNDGLRGSQIAAAAGGMFNAAGGAIQQIAVGQRLGQVANISGYAGIENDKYNTYKAARGGDVLSQMMATQYDAAQGFGKELKLGQQVAVGAYTAGSVAQTVAGGFQMAEGGAQKANPLAYASGASSGNTAEVLAGAQNVVQGTAGMAVNGTDLLRGVSTNAAAIQGTQAQMEARRAVLKVQAEQLQGFRDFGVGMGVAAQGMGGRGEAFLQNAMSDKGMQNMVDARMSPEQMAQMSQMGVAQQGSVFKQDSVFAARGAERSGFGTMAENMQRMSSLAAAGSNNPQAGLSSVLEAAFTKSLDSSKAISMVAENTAAMMKNSAGSAVGIDTTAATAAMVTAGVNKSNPNQEMATQRSAIAADITNQNANNVGVDFAGMVNTSRLSKKLGISTDDAISLNKVDIPTLKALQGKSTKEQQDFFINRGIDTRGKNTTNFISKALDYKADSILEAGGVGMAYNIQSDAIRKKIQSGEKLTVDEKLKLGKVGVFAGYTGADEISSQVGGVTNKSSAEAAKKAGDVMKGDGGSATLKTLDDLRTSGFKQLSEAAQQATKSLGGAVNALKTLTDMSQAFEKMGASGAENKFSTAAVDAAANFKSSANTFAGAVGRFEGIMDKAGLGVDKTKDRANQAMNTVDKSSKDSYKGRVGNR